MYRRSLTPSYHLPTVLVVEDTEMCAMCLISLLNKLGCTCDHAENGQEAVQRVKDRDDGFYSLVLMDLRMPVMDGLEATRIIKQELKRSIPVIALTADESSDIRQKCASLEFEDFVSKPLKFDSLKKLIEKHSGAKFGASA